jgi:hypothetical protein
LLPKRLFLLLLAGCFTSVLLVFKSCHVIGLDAVRSGRHVVVVKGYNADDIGLMFPPPPAHGICFVKSTYGNSGKTSDKAPSVKDLKFPSDFRFFIFTNMPDVNAPGWTVILQNETSPYKRAITQSRWPKFMAWSDPLVSQCRTVFYSDGHFQIIGNTSTFREQAEMIHSSPHKFGQYLHPTGGGIPEEFARIKKYKKDNSANIQKSKEWLRAQPDYADNSTIYANWAIGKYER